MLMFFFSGIRAIHFDGDTSDVAGRVGDRPRVYVCDAETSAHDHVRFWEKADPDVP